MLKKVRVVLISIMVLVCFGVFAHGAKSEGSPDALATIYFKSDSAEIKSDYEGDLKNIQAALDADPFMGLRIEAYGHKSDASEKNRDISQKRIQAIKQWFSKNGIAENRLLTQKHIDTKAATRKSDTENPARSERVEILQVALKAPLAFLPAARYQFDAVVEGQEVSHDFIVQNKGSAPLDIMKVKTD